MLLKNSHSSTKPTAAALKSSGGGGVACRFLDEPSVATGRALIFCALSIQLVEKMAMVLWFRFHFWGFGDLPFSLIFELQDLWVSVLGLGF